MFERAISIDEVSHVLATGEVIANYPDDVPYPSRLLLGRAAGRALHIVAARNAPDDETIIVTVYEPDPDLWTRDLKRRRRSS